MEIKINISDEMLKDVLVTLISGTESFFPSYGIEIQYEDTDYRAAKFRCKPQPCYEEVLAQIVLDGKPLRFVDVEDNGKNDVDLTLMRIKSALTCSLTLLADFINLADNAYAHEYDADDYDRVLQTLLWSSVIFG